MLFDGYKLIRVWLGGLQINHGNTIWVLTRFCHVSGCAELHTPFISISSLGIFSTQTFAGIEIKQKTRFAGKPLLSHASCSTTPDVPNSPDAVITPGPHGISALFPDRMASISPESRPVLATPWLWGYSLQRIDHWASLSWRGSLTSAASSFVH